MKKIILILLMVIVSAGSLFASSFADDKIEKFFFTLKEKKYGQAIEDLLKGSSLEQKILNVSQNKTNWINQFKQINDLYGDYWGYEHVYSIQLGKLEESYYFFYCEGYLIQIVITEYTKEDETDIVNFLFNDEVIDTLRNLGSKY